MILALMIVAAFIILLVWGMKVAHAEAEGTWAYGSPGDVRRIVNQRLQDDAYYGRRGCGWGGYDPVISTWMDLVVRTGSPTLYRQTMPPAPQTNIILYNAPGRLDGEYINNLPAAVIHYDPARAPGYHVPSYPRQLLP